MKRIVLLASVGLFIAALAWASWPESYGPPSWAPAPAWAGPGAGRGWGGPPWGGGPPGGWFPGWAARHRGAVPWGGWPGYGPFSQIPQDKRDQLRELTVQTQQTLISRQAAFDAARAAYWKVVETCPLDKTAATKAWETLDGLRRQMFETRLNAMVKAQHILGKDLWEKLHEGWGPYPGGPPWMR